MFLTFTFTILLSLLSACAVQSDFSFDTGGTPGFLDDRLDRIDDAINAEVAAGKIPGAVAVIVKDGRTVFHKSFGYADIEAQKPMRNDSIFRIASMTKAATTDAVMKLYEHGYFQLNDPVSKYIPAFASSRVLVSVAEDGIVNEMRAAARETRIIDLLTHTSGISYAFIDTPLQQTYIRNGVIDGVTEKNIRLESVMAKLAEFPLLIDQGTEWAYGLNTALLGYLVEVISGKPLDRYFAEEIFVPLRMDDTFFPARKQGRSPGHLVCRC